MALRNQKTRADYLEWDQNVSLIHRLGRDGNYKFQLLIALGSFLGLRISDLLEIKWEDILYKDQLYLKEKKTGKERLLRINNDLKRLIGEAYKSLNPSSPYIFTNRKGSKLSTQYINRKLKDIKQVYNLYVNNFSTHSLRKTFGREYWKRNGYSDKALIFLGELFNHSNVATTKKYLGIKDEELLEAYEVLSL